MNGLQALIQLLRQIDLKQDEKKILDHVSLLVKKCITQPDAWFDDRFYQVDEEQGFGSHLIYENPDHTLAVIVTSWPMGRETPPHDHDTWAVIGCVKGVEKNTLWDRHDDKSNPHYAHVTPGKIFLCKPGDLITMRKHDIHSVINPESGVSVSLHIYGKHFNHTNRHQFDPQKNTAKPFIVRQEVVVE